MSARVFRLTSVSSFWLDMRVLYLFMRGVAAWRGVTITWNRDYTLTTNMDSHLIGAIEQSRGK
jgi:hypothetical protein